MEYINGVSTVYIRKFKRKLEQYNKPGPLPAYFEELIGKQHSVRIAELGAGPINTIGNFWPGREVEIVASDVLQSEYEKLWKEHGATPIVPIEYQDMEHLTYPDESFDIVHCVNALDHTKDAKKALSELERICKPEGWVYLRHSSNQKKRFRGHHYWNIDLIGEKGMSFDNGWDKDYFVVDKYRLSWDFDGRGKDENKIIITAVWQKT